MQRISYLFLWVAVALGGAPPQPQVRVLTRDVCIIGGGAAGSYAAVRLQEMNQSVVVVEKKNHLGGHVDTYTDPNTGSAADFGVSALLDIPETDHFLTSLGVPFERGYLFSSNVTRFDFRTGKAVPSLGNSTEGLANWATFLTQHPYLRVGLDLPDPVPEELLLPFGEFLEKYKIGAAAEFVSLNNQGMGDWLRYPALYHLKYFSFETLMGYAQQKFIFIANRNTSSVYSAAAAKIGPANILYSSRVVQTTRAGDGDDTPHTLVVQTPQGPVVVTAKNLVLAMPPIKSNTETLALEPNEQQLVRQWKHSYYYAGVVRVTGLPEDMVIYNRGLNTPFSLPPHPCLYVINPVGVPGLRQVVYGSDTQLSEADVKAAIARDIVGLRRAGYNNVRAPQFLGFTDHSPYSLSVEPEAIRDGYYRQWNSVQGHRNTWWVGSAMECANSGANWRFVDKILARIGKK